VTDEGGGNYFSPVAWFILVGLPEVVEQSLS
jgi:hypothetical protein